MRKFLSATTTLVLLLTGCSQGRSQPEVEPARFETLTSDYNPSDIAEVVEITGRIKNVGGQPAIPRCFLTDRNLGEVQPGYDVELGTDAIALIEGRVNFVLPFFDYECNGDCGDLECYPQDELPEDIEEALDRIDEIPEPGSRVIVPDVDGLTVDVVSIELAALGLKTCWATSSGCGEFLAGLQPTSGPEVSLDPPPGTEVVAGDVIRLTAIDGSDLYE